MQSDSPEERTGWIAEVRLRSENSGITLKIDYNKKMAIISMSQCNWEMYCSLFSWSNMKAQNVLEPKIGPYQGDMLEARRSQ